MSQIVLVEGAQRFYRGQYLQPHPTATEGTVDYADTQEAVDGKGKTRRRSSVRTRAS
jgi:hypothetical protein